MSDRELELQYKKEWYTSMLTEFCADESVDGKLILFEIYKRFRANRNHDDKLILDAAGYKGFLKTVSKCLVNVSISDIIEEYEYITDDEEIIKIPNFLKREFIRMKRPDASESLDIDNLGNVCYMMDDIQVGIITDEKMRIRSLQMIDGDLYIEGFFSARQFIDKGGSIFIKIDDEELELSETAVHSGVRYFSRDYYRDYTIKSIITKERLNRQPVISFIFKYEDKNYHCPISFETPQSRFFPKTRCNYWVYGDNMLVFEPRKQDIRVAPINKGKIFLSEMIIFLCLPFAGLKFKRRLYFIYMRLLYWLTKPKLGKKKIWLYFDKLYKAGDNGEYMFRYAHKQNSDIDHYYVVNKDAKDAMHMEKEGLPLLFYKSRKNKLMALHSHKIFGTYKNVLGQAGLFTQESHFFGNRIHAEILCIQHGLTLQQIPDMQCRIKDNVDRYYCASPYEVRNLMQPEYDYNEGMLKLTGLPRFDGLVSDPKGYILIAPTWRRFVADKVRGLGNKRGYNPHFKESEYYRIYENLINNRELIELSKRHGLKLVFLLHPTMSEQIVDFHPGENVTIVKSTDDVKYETILREANILITDYSGIQFDFAYMKKPLVYYHPETLPSHYDSKVFDYESDGLGPVTVSEGELINAIDEYAENNYHMDEKYLARVDEFFVYNDFNNCRRIYDNLTKE